METNLSNQLTLLQRIKAPTPKFFKTLRTIGLTLAAISTALLASPVAIPVIVTQIAGYIALAGTVVSAVSQTAVEEKVDQSAEQHGATEDPDWEIGE